MNSTYKLVYGGCGRYIGKTEKPLAQRLKEHLREARGGGRNHRLNWLRGLDQPPTIELIEETATEFGAASERYQIALARDYGCSLVNGTDGGEGMSNPSEEIREKLRVSARVHLIGRPVSEATRQKLSIVLFGRKHSEEALKKMRQVKGGKNHPLFGKPCSVETRRKISESRSRK